MTSAPELEEEVEVPATVASLRMARSWLESRLAGRDPDLLQDLKLLVNELISNSLRHAGLGDGDVIRVSVRLEPSKVTGSVCDRGFGFERDSISAGWGMFLLDRLTTSWELSREGGDFCVRFEMPPAGTR